MLAALRLPTVATEVSCWCRLPLTVNPCCSFRGWPCWPSASSGKPPLKERNQRQLGRHGKGRANLSAVLHQLNVLPTDCHPSTELSQRRRFCAHFCQPREGRVRCLGVTWVWSGDNSAGPGVEGWLFPAPQRLRPEGLRGRLCPQSPAPPQRPTTNTDCPPYSSQVQEPRGQGGTVLTGQVQGRQDPGSAEASGTRGCTCPPAGASLCEP